jgi:hypothetical protein
MILMICLFSAFANSESIAYQNSIKQDWAARYRQIQAQIAENSAAPSALSKRSVGVQTAMLDSNACILAADRDPADVAMRRTRALIDDLARKGLFSRRQIAQFRQRLDTLQSPAGMAKSSALERFAAVSALHRQVALTNPLLDFDSILFVTMNPASGHMCDQYFAWAVNQSANGGLYIIAGYKSGNPRLINITANSTVQNGRFAGKKLTGGAFLSPDLSYDGKTIVFAWSPVTPASEMCYHIFKINIDGADLVQLTDGTAYYDPQNYGLPYRQTNRSHHDFDPCWLPSGRIAFISERRGGYGRCHPAPKPTWTLYSMKDDGSDIICLSYHETNEWHPSVNNDGMIAYTRWDYLDRDDCIAHHLWLCYPDGRDPRAPHGNYPRPYTTMAGSSWPDGRTARPSGEWNIRSVPNSPKYVATGTGHHAWSFGRLVLIDPTVADDDSMSQLKCITPGPPNMVWEDNGNGGYGTAWPLSEDYYLCYAENNGNKIILRDRFGGEDVIFTSSSATFSMRPIDPIPLRPRQKPPALTTQTWQGERAGLPDHKRATISIINVTTGDMPLPAGARITALRIMQIIPKYSPIINCPNVGYASEALVRLSLGTVPVEADGSVYCEAPVAKEVYFELLDDKGLAIRGMRACTYVHAGEQMSCAGCHEDKWKAVPPPSTVPLAFRRAPSKLTPDAGAEPWGFTPINYYRLVKPVFDAKCVVCHKQKGRGPQDMSYDTLEPYTFHYCTNGVVCCSGFLKGDIISPIWGGSRSIPGMFGAYYSRMGKALLDPTHQAAGITGDEFKRVCLWLEGNSNELGAYAGSCSYPFACDVQQAGKFVWPDMDVDSANPLGIESAYPLPQTNTIAAAMHLSIIAPLMIHVDAGKIRIDASAGAGLRLRIFDACGRTVAIAGISGGDVVGRETVGSAHGMYLARLVDCQGRVRGAPAKLVW